MKITDFRWRFELKVEKYGEHTDIDIDATAVDVLSFTPCFSTFSLNLHLKSVIFFLLVSLQLKHF